MLVEFREDCTTVILSWGKSYQKNLCNDRLADTGRKQQLQQTSFNGKCFLKHKLPGQDLDKLPYTTACIK